MTTTLRSAILVFLLCVQVQAVNAQSLTLDQEVFLPGSFLTSQAVYADGNRVYAGSFQGSVFVLKQGKKKLNLVSELSFAEPVRSISGDDRSNRFYVASGGDLYWFQGTLELAGSVHLSDYGLLNVSSAGQTVKASKGFGRMVATADTVFVSELNQGDFTVRVRRDLLPTRRDVVYGSEFEPTTTVVFSKSGERLYGIANPTLGSVNLHVKDGFLAMFEPGCCGVGIWFFDTTNAGFAQFVGSAGIAGVNGVADYLDSASGVHYLVLGTEAGMIHLVDMNDPAFPIVASLSLPVATGRLGSEDIEIRSVAVDVSRKMIYAGSTWGNEASRGPDLPSLFVIKVQ